MGNILTKQEIEEMLARGKAYRVKVPVIAIQAEQRFSVENINGAIEVAHPGDYLVTSFLGNLTTSVVKKHLFENSFEVLKEEDTRTLLKARAKQ